ncbi:hypothetical protein FPRO05_08119 [Fusarium proliferatum]|uniref:Uncharacterized protein n=1 Tax=Gibberella intermedia TaxID=948311 RepID=A0A365NJ38_GIBIN|nr:hypothetical protein FPRO05_08119 [Fusarium proliferatum]
MPPSPTQSLLQLSVENSRFATRPLFWTSQHLDLLGIRFLHFDRPIHAPQPRGDAAEDLDAVNVIFHVMRLATVPDTESKIKSAIHLLCTPGSPLQLKPKPQAISPDAATGYRVCLLPNIPPSHPRKKVNSPVRRLCDSHLRRIIPENWAEDPYIVCLLLSLAQAQAIKQKRAMPETFPVRLLVAFDGDKSFAHVFQADVDARILQALNEPRFDLNGITWPNVTHTKVAFDPYLTFPHRIVAEMLGSYMEHM